MFEDLLEKAHNERIEVIHIPLKGKLKGLYYDKTIAINKNIKTTAEKTCILAEELGHYYTSIGNILNQNQLQNRKQERRARAWAYEKLVPLDKLVEAYKAGVKNRFELAEFLHVSEEFLEAAIKHYKEKHGLYCHVTGDFSVYRGKSTKTDIVFVFQIL